MEVHAQFFLRLCRAFVEVLDARAFVYHTRLAEVTPLMKQRSDRVQEIVNAVPFGFGGGTRIGSCVHVNACASVCARVLVCPRVHVCVRVCAQVVCLYLRGHVFLRVRTHTSVQASTCRRRACVYPRECVCVSE